MLQVNLLPLITKNGYIVMLRARMFRSLIVRTGIKERNIRARNIRYNPKNTVTLCSMSAYELKITT